MIVSFSGTAGTGKSTVAKMLAEKLGWPYYYIGGMRRKKAKERGLTLEEYNKLGEKDPSTDVEVDEYQKELGEKEDDFIIEGRTSWYFIPHSFKIFLDADLKVGAERIWRDIQKSDKRNEGKINSLKETEESLKNRMKSDKFRYKKYFGIDSFDKNNYDLVLDTTDLSAQETFDIIYSEVKKRLENQDNKR